MTTQTENLNRADSAEANSRKTTAVDWAVFGCLVAGGVGVLKALCMDRAIDVFVCLLGSLAAFGVVFYLHFRSR